MGRGRGGGIGTQDIILDYKTAYKTAHAPTHEHHHPPPRSYTLCLMEGAASVSLLFLVPAKFDTETMDLWLMSSLYSFAFSVLGYSMVGYFLRYVLLRTHAHTHARTRDTHLQPGYFLLLLGGQARARLNTLPHTHTHTHTNTHTSPRRSCCRTLRGGKASPPPTRVVKVIPSRRSAETL